MVIGDIGEGWGARSWWRASGCFVCFRGQGCKATYWELHGTCPKRDNKQEELKDRKIKGNKIQGEKGKESEGREGRGRERAVKERAMMLILEVEEY